jgi:enoyl-CoA hydratase/carnithine racemase
MLRIGMIGCGGIANHHAKRLKDIENAQIVHCSDVNGDAAEEMAQLILQNSPQAMALSKQAVWGSLERGYGEALEHAWSLLRLHWGHPDFEEGPRAFAEKREPRWNPDPNARSGEDP